MKYEPVFGDQKRLNEQNNKMAEVMLGHDYFGPKFVSIKELSRMTLEGAIPHGSVVLAMRRIIQEPKRWTKADQEAGRLPEVGAEVMRMDDSRHNFVGESIHAGHWALCHGKTKKVFHIPATAVRPVETEAERQQREREEWCSKALDSAGILSEMKCYELKRLGEYIGSIHDALLSGNLPVPVAPEQNK